MLNKILIVCNLVQNLNIIIFTLVLTETFFSLFIRIRNCKWPLQNENIYLNLNYFKIALGKKKGKTILDTLYKLVYGCKKNFQFKKKINYEMNI